MGSTRDISRIRDAAPARLATIGGWFQQACSAAAAFATVPYIVNTLGQVQSGLWFSVQGLVGVFALADFGFSLAVSRQVAHTANFAEGIERPPTDNLAAGSGWPGLARVYRASKTLFVQISIAVALLFVASANLVWTALHANEPPATSRALVWMILGIGCLILLQARLQQAFLEGLGFMYVTRLVNGICLLLGAGLSLGFLRMGWGMVGLAAAGLMTAGTQLAVMAGALHRVARGRLAAAKGHVDGLVPGLWRVAYPLGIVSVGGYLVGTAQIPLLGAIVSPDVVAPLYIATKLTQVLGSALSHIVTAQLPFFTKACAQGEWRYARGLMTRTLALGASAHLIGGLSILLLGPVFVARWVGPGKFIEGTTLMVFVANYVVTSIAGLPAQFVMASGRNPFALSTLAHGCLTVIGTYVFSPRLGIAGVPVAALCAVAATNLWVNIREGARTYAHLSKADKEQQALG